MPRVGVRGGRPGHGTVRARLSLPLDTHSLRTLSCGNPCGAADDRPFPSSPPPPPQGKNLRTFARQLAQMAADETGRTWRIVLPDLRNHGETAGVPGFPAPHTVRAAAGDVIRLMQREMAEKGARVSLLAGHSLGGKVVMEVLQAIKDAEVDGGDEHLRQMSVHGKPRQVRTARHGWPRGGAASPRWGRSGTRCSPPTRRYGSWIPSREELAGICPGGAWTRSSRSSRTCRCPPPAGRSS